MGAMAAEDDNAKRHLLETLLQDSMVMVTLDARYAGVCVPDHLKSDPQLRLNLSFRFGLPMVVGKEGIEATLTFGGVPHACRIPWSGVYMFFSHATGQPFVFPADIPKDIAGQTNGKADNKGPNLQVVEGAGRVDNEAEVADHEVKRATARRGHLRVVK